MSFRYETLAVDVMSVCGLPFLITLSQKIRFVVEYTPCRTSKELANAVRNVIKVYARAGVVCQTALMDGEFKKVRDELLDVITTNICSKNEHVPELERKIRHTKERYRCIKADIPIMEGISDKFSLHELIHRWNLTAVKHCRAHFGSYCVAYNKLDANETNTMEDSARQVICLGPTGNFQGTHKFLCLDTGKVIKPKRFEEHA